MTATFMERHDVSRPAMPARLTASGMALIALVGLIHLVEAPEYWGEVHYVGALFGLTAAGCAMAAIGILRGERWGWLLGLSIAVANAAGYVLSRTVGISQFRENAWDKFFESVGLISFVIELLFIALAMRTLSHPRASRL